MDLDRTTLVVTVRAADQPYTNKTSSGGAVVVGNLIFAVDCAETAMNLADAFADLARSEDGRLWECPACHDLIRFDAGHVCREQGREFSQGQVPDSIRTGTLAMEKEELRNKAQILRRQLTKQDPLYGDYRKASPEEIARGLERLGGAR